MNIDINININMNVNINMNMNIIISMNMNMKINMNIVVVYISFRTHLVINGTLYYIRLTRKCKQSEEGQRPRLLKVSCFHFCHLKNFSCL